MFLHGYLSCKESFNYQIDFFSCNFRVLAPDLSGFGENLPLSSPYYLDDYVSDVLRLLNQLDIKRYNIICHSFGARIALKLATFDKRIDKIIITGGAGLKPRRSISYYIKVYWYKILKKLFKNKDFSSFGSSDYKRLNDIEKLSFKRIINENLDSLLPKITNKVLLIYGKKDTETPIYMAKKFKKGIKNSTLELLDGNHFCFVSNYEKFNNLAIKFLKENS